MQLRSANFATAGVQSKCNPIIIALDRNNNELFRAPLSQIDGMAGAARLMFEQGFRGLKLNLHGSLKVHAWATPNNPTVCR